MGLGAKVTEATRVFPDLIMILRLLFAKRYSCVFAGTLPIDPREIGGPPPLKMTLFRELGGGDRVAKSDRLLQTNGLVYSYADSPLSAAERDLSVANDLKNLSRATFKLDDDAILGEHGLWSVLPARVSGAGITGDQVLDQYDVPTTDQAEYLTRLIQQCEAGIPVFNTAEPRSFPFDTANVMIHSVAVSGPVSAIDPDVEWPFVQREITILANESRRS